MAERKSAMHKTADEGNPADIARYAADVRTGGSYARGRGIAGRFGDDTVRAFNSGLKIW